MYQPDLITDVKEIYWAGKKEVWASNCVFKILAQLAIVPENVKIQPCLTAKCPLQQPTTKQEISSKKTATAPHVYQLSIKELCLEII